MCVSLRRGAVIWYRCSGEGMDWAQIREEGVVVHFESESCTLSFCDRLKIC